MNGIWEQDSEGSQDGGSESQGKAGFWCSQVSHARLMENSRPSKHLYRYAVSLPGHTQRDTEGQRGAVTLESRVMGLRSYIRLERCAVLVFSSPFLCVRFPEFNFWLECESHHQGSL